MQVPTALAAQAPHTQAVEHDLVAGLAAGLDGDVLLAVEGLQREDGAQGGRGHGHAQLGVEVVAVALEELVRLLVDLQVEVAVGAAGRAGLAAPRHADAGPGGHPGGDGDLQVLAHAGAALAGAVLAGGDDDGAVALAARAGRGGHHLSQQGAGHALDVADAVALGAGDRLGAGGAAGALAGCAGDVGVDRDGAGHPEGDVGELHVDGHKRVLTAPGPGGRPAGGRSPTEEGLEDASQVAEVGAGEPAAESCPAAHGVLPAQVVHLTLVGVGEDLVGGGDLLELLLMAGAGDVGVQLAGLLAVGPLDLLGGGVTTDAEDLVVVGHCVLPLRLRLCGGCLLTCLTESLWDRPGPAGSHVSGGDRNLDR